MVAVAAIVKIIVLTSALGGGVVAAPKLVLVKSAELDAACDDLPRVTERVAQYYREAGCEATIVEWTEIERWILEKAPILNGADRDFQLIHFARAQEADAIGGVTCQNATSAEPGGARNTHEGWIINLRRCSRTLGFHALPVADDPKGFRLMDWIDQLYGKLLQRTGGQGLSPALPLEVPNSVLSFTAYPMRMCSTERPLLGMWFDFAGEAQHVTRVSKVYEDSPAAKAGIRPGDVIVSLNQKPLKNPNDLESRIAAKRVGVSVRLEIDRAGTRIPCKLKSISATEYFTKQAELFMSSIDQKNIKSVSGEAVRSKDLKGKVVLLFFQATWCGPCKQVYPQFHLLAEALGNQGLVCIGVSIDERDKRYADFVRRNRMAGIYVQSPEWAHAFGIEGVPTVVAIDRDGRILGKCLPEEFLAATAFRLVQEKGRREPEGRR